MLSFFSRFRSNTVLRARRARATGGIKFAGGRNNIVRLGLSAKIEGSIWIEGSDNTVEIGERVRFTGDIAVRGNGQKVVIGAGTTAEGARILCVEGCDVTIGADCMLSREIEIRTSDYHSVIDMSSGVRINKPRSIVIGDHVWIGMRALISKGSILPTNTIVGASAFVNSEFVDGGTIVGGTPARVLKHNVTWSRKRTDAFDLADLEYV